MLLKRFRMLHRSLHRSLHRAAFSIIVLATVAHSAAAQIIAPEKTFHLLGTSQPGGPLASIPCDSYMTAEQESRILAILHTHDDVDWSGLSLKELKPLLASRLSVWIDRASITVTGIEINQELETSGDVVPGPLGDKLDCLLHNLDLGYSIRANRLEISSKESLDNRSCTRIYDVTPLVLKFRSSQRVFDFTSLSNMVQHSIEPDSWLSAGGMNVIQDFMAGTTGNERGLIVVTAPYSVHLQLMPLLDRINIVAPRTQAHCPSQTDTTPFIRSTPSSTWIGGQF